MCSFENVYYECYVSSAMKNNFSGSTNTTQNETSFDYLDTDTVNTFSTNIFFFFFFFFFFLFMHKFPRQFGKRTIFSLYIRNNASPFGID